MMTTYVMLTQLSPDARKSLGTLRDLTRRIRERVAEACPDVRWLSNLPVIEPYDSLDIFEAPDVDTATRVGLLVRSIGEARIETWVATPWERFLAEKAGIEGRAITPP